MKISRETLLAATLWAMAALFLGLAITGGVRAYSPVPYWDMWDGYLDFYLKVRDGQWSQWWAQHNEHRILLAKILFWIDLSWFRGRVWFLIVVNYLLVGWAFLLYRAMLKARAPAWVGTRAMTLLSLFIFTWLFSWIQSDNLTWGFQSQFFLAHLLPLLALYLLCKSSLVGKPSNARFAWACAVGVLCIGTMANGIFALPIMCACAALLGMGKKRVVVLALLSILCALGYFYGYKSPGTSLLLPLKTDPLRMLQFVLLFLGSPFYHFLGQSPLIGECFGALFLLLPLHRFIQCLRAPRDHALELALLGFIAYIVLSAVAVASGRLMLETGIKQAYSSRYNTPMLMGWAAIMLLYAPAILKSLAGLQHRIVWPMLGLLACMLPLQLKATQSIREQLFQGYVAALALELNVHDEHQISNAVWGGASRALAMARKASAMNISAFGVRPIRDAAVLQGQALGPAPVAACAGQLTATRDVAPDSRYSRISGWVAPAADGKRITAVKLADASGTVVGYALAGDAPSALSPQGLPDGNTRQRSQRFEGYMLHSPRVPLTLSALEGNCTMQLP